MLDEQDVLDQLKRESAASTGAHEGVLAESTEKLNDYYHGKPYGNEVEGRSKFVTREVYETVESIMPYLVKIFFSADKAVVFDPEDEDDVDSAQQETEYVNWVFYRQNPGFKIGYSWLKDGLMNKVGYVKACRIPKPPIFEEYTNQTEDQVALLVEGLGENFTGDVQLVEQDDGLLSVTVVNTSEESETKITNIPPEEFRISDEATCIQDARYVAQHSRRTLSEIREMGFDIDDDVQDAEDGAGFDTLFTDRHEDINNALLGDDTDKGAGREVTLREEYLRIDKDEDGIEELWQFFRVGDTILSEDRVDESGFYSWSPIIVPHRHVGSTPADPVMDIQLLKSKVTRNLLDNQERINNGRYAVVDGQVNLDDLMSNSPLGIVRQNFTGAVQELPTPALDQSAFQVLGYADSLAEKRTGVSERGQGLDPKMFNSNTAASTAELVMSSAEQKLELIARVFAETGLKDLMLGIHRLGMKHEHPDKKIRNNNNQFIAIDPRAWRTRYDMSVTVGIGNGSKNQQMLQMQQIEQTMQLVASSGGLGTLITPTNVWNLAMEKVRVAGRKDGSLFFTRPETDEIDQGPSVEEQAKMAEVEIKQAQVQVELREAEIKELELALKERKLALEERLADLKERIHEDENQFKVAELALEADQKRAVKVGSD